MRNARRPAERHWGNRAILAFESLEDRCVLDGVPSATFANLPTDPLIGENLSFDVTFDNTSPTDPGYGPFIDLYLPATGADGGTSLPFDGISFVSATYLGLPVTSTVLTLTAAGVPHPYARGADGAPLTILPPVGFQPGDQLVVLQLPFGSFTADQTPANIHVTTSVSSLADNAVALPIQAVGGFQFGNDPLDNPATDPSIVQTPPTNATLTTTLMRVTKVYLGTEDETATGPNYTRQYRIVVDIANGQTLTNLDLTDLLPDNLQFVSVDSVTNVGAPATVTNLSTPSTTVPGGTLTRRLSSVTGTAGANDAVLTFSFFQLVS